MQISPSSALSSTLSDPRLVLATANPKAHKAPNVDVLLAIVDEKRVSPS